MAGTETTVRDPWGLVLLVGELSTDRALAEYGAALLARARARVAGQSLGTTPEEVLGACRALVARPSVVTDFAALSALVEAEATS